MESFCKISRIGLESYEISIKHIESFCCKNTYLSRLMKSLKKNKKRRISQTNMKLLDDEILFARLLSRIRILDFNG
ncbi:CLUMA_CG019876, isoform A [Clunio marinus]|uniref:CLUMA_CG019876, isoform A n=1 Tax=Clunio marinus TaxID=568069 RepID=A0A1J1J2Z9_9DIPT|nr:CLUMA_CG019876, isoform A [Clunio marinus]